MDLTDIVDAVTPDSFSTGILDRSGNGLPTAFFDMFLQNGITAAATQTTHASDPNRPPPGCPDTPINLVAPAVKTVNPACDFDVTSRVATHEGPVRPTGVRNRYIQQVLITNTSAETITGEISLALDGLPRDVDVMRPNRVTTRAIPTGSPFVEVKIPLQCANSASPLRIPAFQSSRLFFHAGRRAAHRQATLISLTSGGQPGMLS